MTSKPTSIVIFGASGDLTQRKLIPGLYNLFVKGRLPEKFSIVGNSRSTLSDADFRERMLSGVQQFSAETYTQQQWDAFAPHLTYISGSMDAPDTYAEIDAALSEHENGQANRLYYLSTAPRFFLLAVQQLHAAGMVDETDGWRRVIIEKPFGHDLASAKALNHDLHEHLQEHQIYRIDHYLAKETVQNLLVFRFANTIFERLWNRDNVDNIQITAIETVDVGHRADYYDSSGVLRDMVQNHLMQLTALVAMEPPASFDADAVRNEKVKLLQAIRPISSDQLASHTVRAQYDGYLDANGVAEGSETPTFAAIKFYIDNWRWRGVPFYLRSGKALARKTTEIIIQFKQPPHMMFPTASDAEITANYLAICIQPHEGIHLRFEAKVPDTEAEMRTVQMAFDYEDFFGDVPIPEAYERLLLEALEGDATLFTRSDGIEAAWKFIDAVLDGWNSADAPEMATYDRGSWGPDSAEKLLANDGFAWHHGCEDH